MTVTTFNRYPLLPHEDSELQELLDELNLYSGDEWFCETLKYTSKGLFSRKEKVVDTHTSLYKHLGCGEYQVMCCVSTIGEAKAYLYGALGVYDKVRRVNEIN